MLNETLCRQGCITSAIDEQKVRAYLFEMSNTTDDWCYQELIKKALDALGNDEGKIIAFLNAAEDESKPVLDSLYEELIEKFPSNEMENAIGAVVEWEKARISEVNLRAKYVRHWELYFDGKRHWTYDEWMKEWPTYEDYKSAHPE